MSEVVLDASALLALLRTEPGADAVTWALSAGAWISAVNWSEVLTKLADLGVPPELAVEEMKSRGVLGQALHIAPFAEDAATEAARLRELTRARGLSLADRACLALARAKALPALTADRAWQDLDLGIEVRLIR